MADIRRRRFLQWISGVMGWLELPKLSRAREVETTKRDMSEDERAQVSWTDTNDRVFLNGDCWANPMEDWQVVDGAAECVTGGGRRNIHLITHQVTNPNGEFEMSVEVSQVEVLKVDRGAGFRIGLRSEINEYRSNAFAERGIDAGVRNGQLVLAKQTKTIAAVENPNKLTLVLRGSSAGNSYRLTLEALDHHQETLGTLSTQVAKDSILGNVALINNFANGRKETNTKDGARYRFNDWTALGSAFTVNRDHRFGPLLWTMYTLSDSRSDEGFVMKLSVLTGPLGVDDNQEVELLVQRDDRWKSLGTASLDTDAWVATFRIPNWDETMVVHYKVVYHEKHPSGEVTESSWSGKIRSNPTGRPLRLAALTCQKDYGFPYAPVAQNVQNLEPDLLYFSGDQIYEGHGGFGLIREPVDRAILNYLRKYYMHGWSFRHAMKNAPTICIPDDHDVFQGNIWGEGGMAMKVTDEGASSFGGYREPARMVNAVHKTTVHHHPDFHDPTPILQGISVYYGDMVYGDVSFAIIADRQWKSGPEHVDTGGGRADHVSDNDFDTTVLDKPELALLGEQQEEFLRSWADDWRGHKLKVLLSQTVFAGVATHHGNDAMYLKADLDSGAWPQTARNRAIKILQPAKALHINGDQHLTSLSQYGVDAQRDAFWSFCTPAIAAGYPRWWRPDDVGMPHKNRPQHGLPQTGEYTDGCGNLIYVYAVGNPAAASKKNRYDLAHQKGSGFGMITIDTEAKTYKIESFRFLVDATDGKPSNQFPGWPVTISQEDNAGKS